MTGTKKVLVAMRTSSREAQQNSKFKNRVSDQENGGIRSSDWGGGSVTRTANHSAGRALMGVFKSFAIRIHLPSRTPGV